MRVYTTQLSLFVISRPLLRLSSYLCLLGYPFLLLIFLPLSCTPYLQSSQTLPSKASHFCNLIITLADVLGSLDALVVPASDLSSSSLRIISSPRLSFHQPGPRGCLLQHRFSNPRISLSPSCPTPISGPRPCITAQDPMEVIPVCNDRSPYLDPVPM